MTFNILPDITPMNKTDVYTQESSAFVIALVAIRHSKLPLEARIRFYSLLDKRLEQTHNSQDVEKFSRTCLRIAMFFQRRSQ